MGDKSRGRADGCYGPVDTNTAFGQDQVKDALNESVECNPSTPLLFGSPAGIDGDTEAQETATVPSGVESLPLSRRDRAHIVLTIILLIAAPVVSYAIDVTIADPLEFKRLAWYSTWISFGIAFIMVHINEILVQIRDTAKKSKRNPAPFAIFMIVLIAWGIWLLFYGVAWFWGTIRPGPHNSVIEMNRVWLDLQANIEAPNVLPRLTTCLQDHLRHQLPPRNATIADFTDCLRSMGMK